MNATTLSKPCILSVILCLMLPLLSGFKFQELETADSLMAKVSQSHAVNSEINLIQINTTTSDGTINQQRILSIIRRDPAGNYSYIIRFISPENVKGVTLLTRETGNGNSEQYMFLPALGKVKEIKGSQKSSYFMGTDFTFEDLRKEKTTEYSYSRQFDDVVRGRNCHVILSAPADQEKLRATGYSSRMLYVDQQTFDILKIEIYNDEGDLSKTFDAFDYNSSAVDGPSIRPRRAVMTNHTTGSVSVMVLLKSRLNYEIDPNLFSVQALEAWTPEFTEAYLSVFDAPQ